MNGITRKKQTFFGGVRMHHASFAGAAFSSPPKNVCFFRVISFVFKKIREGVRRTPLQMDLSGLRHVLKWRW